MYSSGPALGNSLASCWRHRLDRSPPFLGATRPLPSAHQVPVSVRAPAQRNYGLPTPPHFIFHAWPSFFIRYKVANLPTSLCLLQPLLHHQLSLLPFPDSLSSLERRKTGRSSLIKNWPPSPLCESPPTNCPAFGALAPELPSVKDSHPIAAERTSEPPDPLYHRRPLSCLDDGLCLFRTGYSPSNRPFL